MSDKSDSVDPMDIFIHEYELSFIPAEDERRRFAWIPSAKTKNTLEKASQMNHTLPRDMLTMPGVENVHFVCIMSMTYLILKNKQLYNTPIIIIIINFFAGK